MRQTKIFLLLIIIYSCNSKNINENSEITTTQTDSLTISNTVESINNVEQNEFLRDTLKIGNNSFTVIQKSPRSESEMNLTILNSNGDTIYIHDTYATNGFEFEDFDNDGVLDIRLNQVTNVGGVSELIMYDKTNSTFKPIVNFDNFPEPTKVEIQICGTRIIGVVAQILIGVVNYLELKILMQSKLAK
jgi:hypothetical protein